MGELLSQRASQHKSVGSENVRIWVFAIAAIMLFGIVYMGQAGQSAVIGQRVQDKRELVSRLNQENAQLEADIAALLAPDRVESKAKALGLHIAKPEQIKYLVVKDYPVESPPTVVSAPANVEKGNDLGASSSSDAADWWSALLVRLGLRTP